MHFINYYTVIGLIPFEMLHDDLYVMMMLSVGALLARLYLDVDVCTFQCPDINILIR